MANLKAGRELDERIATEVMGWVESPDDDPPIGYFQPSTNIKDAWEVVEHCKLFGTFDYLGITRDGMYTFADYDFDLDYYEVVAKTVPMAICKAALCLQDNEDG